MGLTLLLLDDMDIKSFASQLDGTGTQRGQSGRPLLVYRGIPRTASEDQPTPVEFLQVSEFSRNLIGAKLNGNLFLFDSRRLRSVCVDDRIHRIRGSTSRLACGARHSPALYIFAQTKTTPESSSTVPSPYLKDPGLLLFPRYPTGFCPDTKIQLRVVEHINTSDLSTSA